MDGENTNLGSEIGLAGRTMMVSFLVPRWAHHGAGIFTYKTGWFLG